MMPPRESQLHAFRAQDCPQHTRVGHSPFGDKLRSLGWNCSRREMANKPSRLPRTSVEDGCGVYGREERELFPFQLPSQFAVTQPNSRRADDSSSHRPTGARTRDNGKEGGRETPTWGRNKQQVAKKEGKVKWRHVASHVAEKAKVLPCDRKGGQSAWHISR